MSIQFGLFSPFRNPPQWRVPWPEFYESQLRQAEVADDLGYDQFWLSEHHFLEDGWSPSLFPICGAVAQRTRRIRFGTFVILLPLGKHPVQVAEDAATIDILSNGRFDLGVGLGYRVPEFKGFGIPREERPGRMEEQLAILKLAFDRDCFSYDGRYYQLEDVRMTPRPVQAGGPPIWTAIMSKVAAERAARHGTHAGINAGESIQPYYDSVLAQHGKDPQAHYVCQFRLVYVAPTRDQAWDEAQAHAHYTMAGYHDWLSEAADVKWFQETMSVSNFPPPEQLRHTPGLTFFQMPIIVGTPDDAIAEIERSMNATRVTHLCMWMQLPGLDPRKTEACMKLFANEVIPHFEKR